MMKVLLFNPVVGLFLLSVAGIAVAFALAANPSRTELGQVQTTPVSTTILPSITPVISPTLVVTTPAPPPVGTQYPSPVPSITFVRTPTIAPPQQTASVQAYMTALTEEYGPPIPNPNEAEMLAETTLFQSLFTRPATVIAHGTNTVPTGPMGLLTYRVEEITLPSPTTFTRITVGQTITVDRVWRVIISGGPSPEGHEQFNIGLAINGSHKQLAARRGVGGVTFLVFDRSILLEGAALAVVIPFTYDLEASTLPERLRFTP